MSQQQVPLSVEIIHIQIEEFMKHSMILFKVYIQHMQKWKIIQEKLKCFQL